MSNEAQKLKRHRVEVLDEILGVPFKVLDDGFVRLIDYLGSDESIVQAARVSYGAGTKKVSEDRGLIRYLMRHRHTTPFEMCEIKLHVRVPMDCWRQWIRHRTACLAEGTEVYFDLPGGIERRDDQLYTIKIEELWNRFQRTENRTRLDKQRNPYLRRDRVRDMKLRQVNEDTLRLQHTRVVDVYRNGTKPVFRVTLEDGKQIEATADHRFLFENGWRTLKEAAGLHENNGKAVWNSGDYSLYVNGLVCEVPALYQDEEWLGDQYNAKGRRIEDIAVECVEALGGDPVVVEWRKRPRIAWNRVAIARLVRIANIEYVGEKMTYDVEVEGPHHNFVANGIITHNSVNEYSTRYSIAIDATQRTSPGEWRLQGKSRKQGSEGWVPPEVGEELSRKESELQDRSREVYQERLDHGVAREQARKDLPLSTYTEAYWKIDLHNLLHFLSLRMDETAQEEIREYANMIGEKIVARWCPIVWEAFLDYRMKSMGLTRLEIDIIAAIGAGDKSDATRLADSFGWLEKGTKGLLRNRERSEFEAKLRRLNLPVPWRE